MKKHPILTTDAIIFAALTSIGSMSGQTPPTYAVIDLGYLYHDYSVGLGINNNGQVVGNSYNISGYSHGFLWSNCLMQDLGTLGGNYSFVLGMNDGGQVVGYSHIDSYISHAFLYKNGSMQDLGTLGGHYSTAYGINNSGQVVGDSNITTNNDQISHAFLYKNGSMQDLGTLGGPYSTAYGINNGGQVVGFSDTGNTGVRAFLYQNSSLQNLGTLGGNLSIACGINNNGAIVGYSATSNGLFHAFLYSNGLMQDLGGSSNNQANGINNNGQIVGCDNMYVHAVLYSGGTMYDLNNLVVVTNAGWTLNSAQAINDSGQIVGTGINPSSQQHAFLLNPLPPGALLACTNSQTSLPTYGSVLPPATGKDSLVFVTHGWIPYGEDPIASTAWVDSMSNSIALYLVANHISNWQVQGYKWTAGAQPANLDPWSAAQAALIFGEGQGVIVGSQIASQGWTRVHLIAHSAGAGLIDLASAQIKAFAPNTVVHCTFLDLFVGLDNSGYANYSSLANWSDNYFSRDLETGKYTEGCLNHAYNVDVTQLDVSDQVQLGFYTSSSDGTIELNPCYKTESTHGWPITFYANSITGNVSPGYASFGFPLSQEGGLFSQAEADYSIGNTTAQVLGTPDPTCSQNVLSTIGAGAYSLADFIGSIVGQSITGTIQTFQNAAITLFSGSPVWVVTLITPTNSASLVSFDAQFTSATGSHGVLSVYWDTNMIGILDETAVQPGFQHYNMSIPVAATETSHILGLHLDPFTGTQSSILLTNVAAVSAGVTQPFSLSFTTNIVSGLRVLQLTGQTGFNYTVQATTNLISANWANIAILANTNGTVLFVDPDSPHYPFRFYRAVIP